MDHQLVLNAVRKVDHEQITFISDDCIVFRSRLEKQETVILMPDLDLLLGQDRERSQGKYDDELYQIGSVSLRVMLAASVQASYREVFSKKDYCLIVLDTFFFLF